MINVVNVVLIKRHPSNVMMTSYFVINWLYFLFKPIDWFLYDAQVKSFWSLYYKLLHSVVTKTTNLLLGIALTLSFIIFKISLREKSPYSELF